MNWVRDGGRTTFETKSSYCRVAWQGLSCYTAVARLGFKRRGTAVLKSNLIWSIEFGTAVARRLKRALAIHGEEFQCTVSEKVTRVNTHPYSKPGPRRVDMVEKISQVSLLTQYWDRYSLYTLSLDLPAERQRKHYIITDHFSYIKFILSS